MREFRPRLLANEDSLSYLFFMCIIYDLLYHSHVHICPVLFATEIRAVYASVEREGSSKITSFPFLIPSLSFSLFPFPLSLAFPSGLLPPFPASSPFPFPPHPLPPPNLARVSGERCKLPQGGLGRNPAEIKFRAY